MASSVRRSITRSAILGLAVAGLFLLVASVATPARPLMIRGIRSAESPFSLALVAVAVAALAVVAFATVFGREPDDGMDLNLEEPLLPRPHMPSCNRPAPVISVIGLEPGSGASTVAFNLAAVIAAEGSVASDGEPPRALPVCVLSEGPLAAAVGVSSERLEQYLADHPGYLGRDVVGLAIGHPAGFDLLCIRAGQVESAQLPRLLDALRKEYDAVIFDCPYGAERLAWSAAHESDVVVLSALPTGSSASAAALWALRCWELGEENKTSVMVNRVKADSRLRAELTAGYHHRAQLPEDPLVATSDAAGQPWVLNWASSARAQLLEVARQMLPALFGRSANRAA